MTGSSKPEDRHEALLRRALRREADQVRPVGDGLARIQARTAQSGRGFGWRRPALVAGVAAVSAASVVGAAAAFGILGGPEAVRVESPAGPPRQPAERPAPTPEPTLPSVTPSPGDPGEQGRQPAVVKRQPVYVYYLGDSHMGPKLYRERRTVDVADGATVKAALTTMFAGRPLDADYRSLWPRGTAVRGISRAGQTLTVDLTRDALAGQAAAAGVRASVQQLVYTTTANLPDVKWVRLSIGGQPASELWGHPVGEQPLRRAPQAEVQAPIWIVRPAEGAVVGPKVQFGGVASVVEATVNWEVRRDGAVVDTGFDTATNAGPAFGEWAATVTLAPGTYELRAFEVSLEDGREMFADTKTLTVR